MIASLPMYDRPETAAANDRFWCGIRDALHARGINAPQSLTRDCEGVPHWLAPDLCFSQTCGRPYRLKLHGKVTLISTPDYGLKDCPAGYYRSAFVVRTDDSRRDLRDFRDARLAYNGKLSQSGWAAAQNHAAPLGFQFENIMASGSHRYSALAVTQARADIATLDAVTWRYLQQYDDFTAKLRVLEWTTPTPGLPFIAGKGADATAYFTAVSSAIAGLSKSDRTIIGIKGMVEIAAETYLAVPNP